MRRRRVVIAFTLLALPLLYLATSCCPCHPASPLSGAFSSLPGAPGNIRTEAQLQADRDCIPATAPRARVLTYNVNFGGPGMDEEIAAIRKADADVVCLQETTAGWNHLLAQEFAGQYPYHCNREFGGAG
ncbi:MAG TPA: endonuclease/exonuclease/phosphatase family protein, partial [Planctomycetota bacterium]|nr:endonuclease/exonuclease/phosphatase family protein [Planctomycetota bacterium]